MTTKTNMAAVKTLHEKKKLEKLAELDFKFAEEKEFGTTCTKCGDTDAEFYLDPRRNGIVRPCKECLKARALTKCIECLKEYEVNRSQMYHIKHGRSAGRCKSCSKKGDRNPFPKMSEEAQKARNLKLRGQKVENPKAPIYFRLRQMAEYKEWRESVFKRDDFKCQFCGQEGGELNADHIIPFAVLLHENNVWNTAAASKCEALWNVDNGRTLCKPCHLKTDTWGGKGQKKIKWMTKNKMELIKISDNLYVPTDFNLDHSYYADPQGTKRYYGITTVLGVIAKPQLIPWASNMNTERIEKWVVEKLNLTKWPDTNVAIATDTTELKLILEEARVAHTKKKEKAGELGTAIHEELEGLIKDSMAVSEGKLVVDMLRADAPAQVREFVQWAIVNNVKFLASEQRLYSEKLWVAGTADFICEMKGNLYVGDIKTSSGIYPEMFLQATAYAFMAREMGLYQDFKGVVIVNIPKWGGLQVKENFDLKGNFAAFKAALTLFKFQQSQKVKKIKK